MKLSQKVQSMVGLGLSPPKKENSRSRACGGTLATTNILPRRKRQTNQKKRNKTRGPLGNPGGPHARSPVDSRIWFEVVAVLDLGLHRRMDHDSSKGISSLATKWPGPQVGPGGSGGLRGPTASGCGGGSGGVGVSGKCWPCSPKTPQAELWPWASGSGPFFWGFWGEEGSWRAGFGGRGGVDVVPCSLLKKGMVG